MKRYEITVDEEAQWTPPGIVRPKIDTEKVVTRNDGKVVFSFPVKFKVPEDWETIFNGSKERFLFIQEAIEIKVEPVGSQTAEDVAMTWKV